MQFVMDRKQMQELDRYSIESMGISGRYLMERAAEAVVQEIEERFAVDKKILIVVESGNNGGDGFAVSRMLKEKGYKVFVYYIHGICHCTDAFEEQLELAIERDVPVFEDIPADESFDVVIDAVFGVGLHREIRGKHAKAIAWMNRLLAYRIAVDIASGVHATSGELLGEVFHADLTITFGYYKLGMLLYPGKECSGEVVVKDIGFPKESLFHVDPCYITFGRGEEAIKEAFSFYPKRYERSNKGSYGNVLLVAGSKGMAGAAYFAAEAAYKSGCGLVRILTHESNRVIIQNRLPEAVVITYETMQEACDKLDANWMWADSVLVGSGLGQSETAVALTRAVVTYVQEKKGRMPVVVDGDSLTILGHHEEILTYYSGLDSEIRGYLILTPHLKEFSCLCGKPVKEIADHMVECSSDYLKSLKMPKDITLVLKDARSLVTDGKSLTYINMTGNHGMATAGSGDVLAGMITAFLAQTRKQQSEMLAVQPEMFVKKISPYLFGVISAVCLHGAAGDAACRQSGSVSMMASDILKGLVEVMKNYEECENIRSLL